MVVSEFRSDQYSSVGDLFHIKFAPLQYLDSVARTSQYNASHDRQLQLSFQEIYPYTVRTLENSFEKRRIREKFQL